MASILRPSTLLEKVKFAASFPQTPVSIKQMVEFGRAPVPLTILKGSQFVHRELPVRLAHRVVELENLPHNLSQMPSIIKVKEWYTQSFQDLLQLPEFRSTSTTSLPNSVASKDTKSYYVKGTNGGQISDEAHAYIENFTRTIEIIKKRHDPTQMTIAQGIMELKENWRRTNNPLFTPNGSEALPLPTTIQSFLDRFYLSRIGIRMLIGQHVALAKSMRDPSSAPEDYVGIICTKTHVGEVAQDAIDNARFICSEYYGMFEAPPVKIMGTPDVNFMYVPSHLHHCLFELLKNSLRAVVERFGADADEFPEIRVIIAEGHEDITIKISDEGGGIPRSGMPLIWSYMYTTADNPIFSEEGESLAGTRVPMAGFGYGLPLSRLYARYFGGDLRLISMEGFGTDAYLHLCRLSDSDEPLT